MQKNKEEDGKEQPEPQPAENVEEDWKEQPGTQYAEKGERIGAGADKMEEQRTEEPQRTKQRRSNNRNHRSCSKPANRHQTP